MSTTRKIFISAAVLCILVSIEGIYSAVRHYVAHDHGAALIALTRAVLAWWIGWAITSALKANPEE